MSRHYTTPQGPLRREPLTVNAIRKYFSNYEATLKIAARLRSTSASVVAHDDTLMRIAV
jgi:hypothetical protein